LGRRGKAKGVSQGLIVRKDTIQMTSSSGVYIGKVIRNAVVFNAQYWQGKTFIVGGNGFSQGVFKAL
jgi:hypothetical protein